MSKHILEINFDEIKYNLYEILAVPNDCCESKIKKAYRKLIIKFHPDKNNLIDEEIYNHLTLANQIITNCDLRSKYDEWLKFIVPHIRSGSLKNFTFYSNNLNKVNATFMDRVMIYK